MSGQQDAEEYFDLLGECAIKTMEQKPVGTHTAVFWRERCGKAWRNVYSHMTRPSPQLAAGNTEEYRRVMALRFAALSREAAMAAWALTYELDNDDVSWTQVAKRFVQMGEQMAPLL